MWSMSASALDVPAAPPLNKPIVDSTGTLTDEQIDELSTLINRGRTEKSYELGVYILPSLEGEDLESYSLRVARQWDIGDKNKKNGALLLIVKNDHRMRIEVSSGIEGELTDLEAGRILDNVIAPEFKKQAYYEGILAGIESLQAQIEGREDPHSAETGTFTYWFWPIWLFLIASTWFGSILARSKSWWAGGIVGAILGCFPVYMYGYGFSYRAWLIVGGFAVLGLIFDYFVSRNYTQRKKNGLKPSWWAGGGGGSLGGGSSSGGGSFGGGGGGFSGGGASGSW